MGSNFHYSIDLNEDQNHHEQHFLYHHGSSSSLLHHQVPYNPLFSSSSISSLSSYLPFLINSQEDQHVPYKNTTYQDHLHLSQSLKAKMFLANGGSSSSSYDHILVPKKETKLKQTIRQKYHQEGQTDLLHQKQTKLGSESDKWLMSPKMRLIKKTITRNKQTTDHTYNNNNTNNNKEDHYSFNQKTYNFGHEDHDEDLKNFSTRKTSENPYNTTNESDYSNNNGLIRVCSDCNTTKTPLWRSGPQGPKSLCNACGIRQRKARRAAMTAAGNQEAAVGVRMQQLPLKKKLQNKKKRSKGGEKYNLSPSEAAKAKNCKIREEDEAVAIYSEISKSTTSSNSSISSSNKLICFDELKIMLSRNSAYQQVFPQDEKEAAILLMALSYGMVHG